MIELIRVLPATVAALPWPVQVAGVVLAAAAAYGLHRLLSRL
ncbi:hypothetical protein [Micromonospora sp. WMMC273]|nr:hypothetical protein [Micromonospora sp. WMMC273]MCZ7478849.1 hypothetical protein [Micromonospora sp. WMMC273]